ncbi:hypothetical protein GCM10010104_53320 [Streptomyces indiaensis]|uniref:Uncharacterized protein n=1 Tax=Streptomyces indiaensis TaxID=284033 RepID=A0ABN3E776_9ACTN
MTTHASATADRTEARGFPLPGGGAEARQISLPGGPQVPQALPPGGAEVRPFPLPGRSRAQIASGAGRRFALAGAKCERQLPARYGPAPEVSRTRRTSEVHRTRRTPLSRVNVRGDRRVSVTTQREGHR